VPGRSRRAALRLGEFLAAAPVPLLARAQHERHHVLDLLFRGRGLPPPFFVRFGALIPLLQKAQPLAELSFLQNARSTQR
jgi:hypothetical protein